MLLTIVHQDESGETSIVDVQFLPATARDSSYVVTTGFDIRAACARKQERIRIERSSFEFHTAQQYRVKLHRWTDPDTMPWVAINNKHAAEMWVSDDRAVFGVNVIGVYVDSTDHVVTLYIPHNAIVEAKTDEAYIVL